MYNIESKQILWSCFHAQQISQNSINSTDSEFYRFWHFFLHASIQQLKAAHNLQFASKMFNCDVQLLMMDSTITYWTFTLGHSSTLHKVYQHHLLFLHARGQPLEVAHNQGWADKLSGRYSFQCVGWGDLLKVAHLQEYSPKLILLSPQAEIYQSFQGLLKTRFPHLCLRTSCLLS